MNVTSLPSCFGIGRHTPCKPSLGDKLVSMVNERTASPLEAARQALLSAKEKLELHRNGQIEGALEGYLTLRSRQTSYESGLDAHRQQLEQFQALSARRDQLSQRLSAAGPVPEGRLSPQVNALEQELAAVDRDISAHVEQANRYAASQRKYADYLAKTGQDGYAAFEYQQPVTYTRENFAGETQHMIERMETGYVQWRERVSSYCEAHGMTPYDFERYLQERRELGEACFAAQQRFRQLLDVSQGAASQRSDFDTVEIRRREEDELIP